MRRLICVLVLSVICFVPVQAEEEYALIKLSADEYLQAISTLLPSINPSQLQVIEAEITNRYINSQWSNSKLAETIYTQFSTSDDLRYRFNPEMWLSIRVVSWLNDNNYKLTNGSDVLFDDATIHITEVDLDSDKSADWILNYTSEVINGILFIRLDSDGYYVLLDSPLDFEFHEYEFRNEANFEIIAIDDFTQDHNPDVAVLKTEYSEYSDSDYLYILSLQNHVLVDVSDETRSVTYQIDTPKREVLNLDDDDAMEIRQTRELRDNWDCYYTRTTVFDWQSDVFTEVDRHDEFPESAFCDLRFAEEAMWAGDYKEAIQLYQTYLEYETYAEQYPTIRLSIALALDGQVNEGINLLKVLQAQEAAKTDFTLLPLINQILDTYEDNPTSISVCLAAYNYFASHPFDAWSIESLEVGYTIDNIIYGQGMHAPYAPSPSHAGCDLPELLDNIIANSKFQTNTNPVEQLADIGIISDSAYQNDLNQDNIHDWIVSLPTSTLLFLSGELYYHVSPSPIIPLSANTSDNALLEVYLYNLAQPVLLNITYSKYTPPPTIGTSVAGGPGNCEASGRLRIVKLVDNELQPLLNTLVCEVISPSQALDDINDVKEVYGWEYSDALEDYVPVTYIWNKESQSFKALPDLEATITPQTSPSYASYNPIWLYLTQDFDPLSVYYAEAVNTISDPVDMILLQWRYIYALALEDQGNTDEALAEFVTIYEAAPDSIWGKLAQLHFEVMES